MSRRRRRRRAGADVAWRPAAMLSLLSDCDNTNNSSCLRFATVVAAVVLMLAADDKDEDCQDGAAWNKASIGTDSNASIVVLLNDEHEPSSSTFSSQ
jgi:hypothetical protein